MMDGSGAVHRPLEFLSDGGEMGALIRTMDWSKTSLGPVETWSQSLRMMASFLLANRFPLLLWWGPEFCQLYNDPYCPVLGTKHPRSMGQPASECWSEIWDAFGPLIETPFNGGPATLMDDIFLELNRHDFVEETHFTIAYSPVPDETAPRGIGGVLASVHEITDSILAERRSAALRDLGTRTWEAKTAQKACAVAAEMLAKHPKDVPFALFYLIDPDGKHARLAGSAGIGADEVASPSVVSLGDAADCEAGWPLAEVVRSESMVRVDDLAARFTSLPPGPWSDPPNCAVVVPVRSHTAHELAGLFVAGVSSRLRLDDHYRNFFEFAATQIATAIGTARAHEDERKRAESLAEIAKATAIGTARAHEDERKRAETLADIAKATAIGTARAHEDERKRAESLAEIAKATAIATARAHEDERKRADSLAEIAKATAIATERAQEDERKRADSLAEIAKATAIATARAHEDERKRAESLAEIAKATAIGTARAHEDERKSAESLAEIAKATAIATARAHEDERKSAESLAEIAKATAIGTARAHEDERKSAESLAEIAKATAIATARAHEDERKSAESLAEIAKATAIATARAHEDERKSAESLAEIAKATAIATARAHEDERKSAESLAEIAKATAIGTARAHEDERKRAESLAEIAKAKTTFFSNVSHEFRTPLTLMLGPLEEILAKAEPEITPDSRKLVTVVQRNGLRLLKLVNSLLEFSRIEAGRVQASYEPVDLALLTAELASNFRSACEKAGLVLDVDCAAVGEPVYVDRDMWEKIVLNLLSNAFKFTFEGRIIVALRRDGDHVALSVRDTGTGVPEHEITRLFDHFHRVEFARSRTDEGSGIGLALVQELVKLHGGTVRVASAYGEGSTFTVMIPLGAAHLPPGRIGTGSALDRTSFGGRPYVEETLRWLPDGAGLGVEIGYVTDLGQPLMAPAASRPGDDIPTILLAEDNPDMRDYVRHLLGGRYHVRAVADGEAALAALRECPPDLLLTDVMMPGLDGFGLLRAVRADPALADLPVVLLSARAGDAATIEGMEAGADDYIVKPFSTRELVARIQANLDMSRLRSHRKRAEGERERLASIVDHSSDFIGIFDTQLHAIHVNNAGRKLVGLDTLDDVRQTEMEQYFVSEDRKRFETDVLPAVAQRGRWTGELTFRHFGTPAHIPVMYDFFRINDPMTGQQSHFGTIARDITLRKYAEEALRKTQAQLQAIVNDAPIGVYMVDADFRVILVNPTAILSFGDVPDLIGRDFNEVIHFQWPKTYADQIVKRFHHTLDTGEPYTVPEGIEERRDRGVTEYYEWHINRVPLPEGRNGVVCYFRDISVQVFARRAIAASEERLRFMAESMPQKIFTALPSGDFDYVNEQWVEFTGLSIEQIQHWGWTQIIHPDDRDDSIQAWQHAVDSREAFEFIHRFRRADGAYRWHLSRAQAMRDASGNTIVWLGSSTDIHEQKETEAALHELSENLERKVAHRTRALEAEIFERQKVEATLRQTQKMEAVGQLTGGIAHDFNNILAAVLGNLELAERRAVDPVVQKFLGRSQMAAERGAKLVDHLLSFARKQPLRRAACDLNLIITNFNDLLKRTIGSMVDVRLALAIDLWTVMADPTQFEMAILNLAVNARDAMPDGGTLVVETTNLATGSPELPTDLEPGDYVCVSVQDDGTGMSAEVEARVFEPFYTTKGVGKGTGLGLSQVYGFSKQLGGTTTVSSQLGAGTTIGLLLPRALELEQVMPTARLPVTRMLLDVQTRNGRLLVIDDETDVRGVAVEALSTLGFDVAEAESGRLGLDILSKGSRVDLAVVDFSMPEMNGLEFIRRARLSRPDLPCLLVTGYADASELLDASSADIRVLRKPYRIGDLAAALDSLLLQSAAPV
jgi:PAS domain S-box-containing protein